MAILSIRYGADYEIILRDRQPNGPSARLIACDYLCMNNTCQRGDKNSVSSITPRLASRFSHRSDEMRCTRQLTNQEGTFASSLSIKRDKNPAIRGQIRDHSFSRLGSFSILSTPTWQFFIGDARAICRVNIYPRRSTVTDDGEHLGSPSSNDRKWNPAISGRFANLIAAHPPGRRRANRPCRRNEARILARDLRSRRADSHANAKTNCMERWNSPNGLSERKRNYATRYENGRERAEGKC